MQIVVCDNDVFMREMVESLVRTTGHEVLGIADTTADAVGLIESGRPDAVVVDLSLGYNTDFDVIRRPTPSGGACDRLHQQRRCRAPRAGTRSLRRSIPKPDLVALEKDLLRRLGRDEGQDQAVEQDRQGIRPRMPRGRLQPA